MPACSWSRSWSRRCVIGGSRPVLSVRRLTKRFSGLGAVGAFSHECPPVGVAGIIGPNGAGKTTLLHAIAGYHGVDEGVIDLGGQPITGWPPSRRARAGLMRTFQFETAVPGLTVLKIGRA